MPYLYGTSTVPVPLEGKGREGKGGECEGRESLPVGLKDIEHTQEDDSRIQQHVDRIKAEHPDWAAWQILRAAYDALNSAPKGRVTPVGS